MPSTFVHGLLPSSCVLISRRALAPLERKELWKLALACFIIGNLPDLDMIPASLMPLDWKSIHRYWGHNLFSLAIATSVGAWALRRYVCPRFGRGTSWWLSVSLVLSHVILDAMGDFSVVEGRRVGVPLLYPFTKWEFLLPFPLFGNYRLHGGMHPLLGHLFSYDYWHHAVISEVVGSLVLLALWVTGFTAYGWFRKLVSGDRLATPSRSDVALDNENPAA